MRYIWLDDKKVTIDSEAFNEVMSLYREVYPAPTPKPGLDTEIQVKTEDLCVEEERDRVKLWLNTNEDVEENKDFIWIQKENIISPKSGPYKDHNIFYCVDSQFMKEGEEDYVELHGYHCRLETEQVAGIIPKNETVDLSLSKLRHVLLLYRVKQYDHIMAELSNMMVKVQDRYIKDNPKWSGMKEREQVNSLEELEKVQKDWINILRPRSPSPKASQPEL
eukprot:TRINITY_DN4411_c0_g1_i4.p1 TRINITY_DN4411_c0_g1~~TRINITY_DN4411_c0_g1_i4.p1  ORF type:complete len:221 (+),score=55.98 TRINITY_DN4411_c0_g1_i4:436-1098(+)